jgi:tetratricopeptide (TPR) repeat protein
MDWNYPYQGIFYCNSVLDHISVLDDKKDRNRIQGWALFSRAYLYHSLATTFAAAYDPITAKDDPGIPLKLNSNIDELEQRSTLEQTYAQIIQDILDAADLIPNEKPLSSKNHPSKAAAYALLARVYMNLREYSNAELYADKALGIYDELIDYNTLDTLAELPFTYNGEETIYYSRQVPNYSASSYGTRETSYLVNGDILNLFSGNDLRKSLYFIQNSIGNYCIKPINTQIGRPFTGLAVDELFLIKAECLARDNKVDEALGYLNHLLKTRMKTGTFVPMDGVGENVLDVILTERRKALVWRGLRWVDLKRLNKEGANITLTRELNGAVYELPPNDPRWVFPAPDEEISLQ